MYDVFEGFQPNAEIYPEDKSTINGAEWIWQFWIKKQYSEAQD